MTRRRAATGAICAAGGLTFAEADRAEVLGRAFVFIIGSQAQEDRVDQATSAVEERAGE